MRRAQVSMLVGGVVGCVALAAASCTIPVSQDPAVVTSTTQITMHRPLPSPSASPEPGADPAPAADPQQAVAQIVANTVAQYGGRAEFAVADAPDGDVVAELDPKNFPAWSTIKVPIAIAALEQNPGLASVAEAAITASDNAAAAQLWASTSPEAVNAVLARGGSPISVNTVALRPEFSVFGQTNWTADMQARFAAALPYEPSFAQVYDMMGRVVADQRYGLGQLESAHFKGGWGPTPSGLYEVRQFGTAVVNGEVYALALTAAPADGSYATAQAMATSLAQEFVAQAKNLPHTIQ